MEVLYREKLLRSRRRLAALQKLASDSRLPEKKRRAARALARQQRVAVQAGEKALALLASGARQ